MKALPNIRHLSFFRMLCEEMNYRRAAQQLGITQPALTAAIKEMEAQFGGPLIDRSVKRIVRPTAAGQALYLGAHEIIDKYTVLCEEVMRVIDPKGWTIRMGVIPTIAPFLMPGLLPKLKAELPQADIRIIEATSAQLRDKLESGEIDYALMAFPFSTPGCHQEVLGHERFVCAVPADNDPFPEFDSIFPFMLEDQKILLLDDGHCLRSHALEACQLKETQEQKALQAASLTTIINMVSTGHGITLLPLMAAQLGTLPANIKLKEFREPKPTRDLGVAWRTQTSREPDYKIFTEAVRRMIRSMATTRRAED